MVGNQLSEISFVRGFLKFRRKKGEDMLHIESVGFVNSRN